MLREAKNRKKIDPTKPNLTYGGKLFIRFWGF